MESQPRRALLRSSHSTVANAVCEKFRSLLGILFCGVKLQTLNHDCYSTDPDHLEQVPANSHHWMATKPTSSLESRWLVCFTLTTWDPQSPDLRDPLEFPFDAEISPLFIPLPLGTFPAAHSTCCASFLLCRVLDAETGSFYEVAMA